MSKILIVDDSPTESHILSKMLESKGYQIVTAASGEAGVDVAKQEMPDLVLMDVVMPGLNGFQATRQLKKDPTTAHIPVIIVTTKDQETDKIWGMRQGAKDYLTKPVEEANLISTIQAILGR